MRIYDDQFARNASTRTTPREHARDRRARARVEASTASRLAAVTAAPAATVAARSTPSATRSGRSAPPDPHDPALEHAQDRRSSPPDPHVVRSRAPGRDGCRSSQRPARPRGTRGRARRRPVTDLETLARSTGLAVVSCPSPASSTSRHSRTLGTASWPTRPRRAGDRLRGRRDQPDRPAPPPADGARRVRGRVRDDPRQRRPPRPPGRDRARRPHPSHGGDDRAHRPGRLNAPNHRRPGTGPIGRATDFTRVAYSP